MRNIVASRSRIFLTIVGTGFLFLAEYIDHITGPEVSLTIFYLIPIALFVLYLGKWIGILMAMISLLAWLVTTIVAGPQYSSPIITYWNLFSRTGIFIFIIYLLLKVQTLLRREEVLSRTDFVTGVGNNRIFRERLEIEVSRSLRYKKPFSVAYLDIDNFKTVNDRFGHAAGDKLLRAIADLIKSHIRSVDVVARLGGDEFGILFPETESEGVGQVIEKIKKHLEEIVRKEDWPVTLSIGVATHFNPTMSVDQIITKADELMYSAKTEGKNRVKQEDFKS